MKELKLILLITLISFLHNGCKIEMPICTGLSNSYPIVEKKKQIENTIGIGGDFNAFFNPLFLPIKIVYNSKSGFSIIDEGEIAILTLVGTVGIDYTIGSKEDKVIYGHKITESDFLVGLVDRRKNENTLYKIEGYNRLKVVTTGRTQIDAQAGYIEIDITDATVQELTFIDNSKISIVNNTDEVQEFIFVIKDFSSSESQFVCEVEPRSYKYFPRFGISTSINSSFGSDYHIRLKLDDEKNNLSTTISKKVDLGDACHIIVKNGKIELQKRDRSI